MLQTELIHKFLHGHVIAVIGVSRKKDIPANAIFQKFKQAGYEVYPINPYTEDIDGIKCYPDINSLPSKPDSVLLAGKPQVSESTVEECISLDIKYIWMHRGIGQGSYSKKADTKCRENGIEPITNGCPMMFVKPVDPFHRIFKWFK
jgi:predicted CoA-binding protein